MTATMRPLARIPERVLIEEMDTARRMAETADRIHDRIAFELGYERVRINGVAPGDRLVFWERGQRGDRLVTKIDHRVEDPSSWFLVNLSDPIHGNVQESFDDGEFVSRLLPPVDEAF